MKQANLRLLNLALVSAALIAASIILPAADEPPQATPSEQPKPTRQELRDQLKNLSPAERDAKLKEFREKYGRTSPEREAMEKRRQELKNLSPEEREKKIREWRQETVTNAPSMRTMSAEEREAHRKAIRTRLQQQLEELRKAKAKGPLTPEQQKRLERLEEITKRFEQNSTNKTALPVPAPPVPEKAN